MSVNKVILLGHLGQDPELKYTPSGAAVCKFSLATNESWTDRNGQKQDRTEWHRVTVWGKMAELCNQYLSKGRQAYVEGSLQTNSWEAQDGSKRYSTEISARTVKFIGGGAQASRGGASPQMEQSHGGSDFGGGGYGAPQQDKGSQPSGGQGFNMPSDNDFTADDIPF